MGMFLFFQTQKVMPIPTVFMQKGSQPKKIPVLRICLPHWRSLNICSCHIVASVLTKFEVLPAKLAKVCGCFFFNFLEVALKTRQVVEKS